MPEETDNKEDKFEQDFTLSGEAYITLEQARVLAIRHARDNPEFYGSRYAGINFVWEVLSQEGGEEFYDIKLSFRPAGRFRGEPGVEQFIIDKMGNIEIRQLLDEPTGLEGAESLAAAAPSTPPQTPARPVAPPREPAASGAASSASGVTQSGSSSPAASPPRPQPPGMPGAERSGRPTTGKPWRGDFAAKGVAIGASVVVVVVVVVAGIILGIASGEGSQPVIVEREVIKEVPRQVVVEREVVKEIPMDVVIEKDVAVEVPVDVFVTATPAPAAVPAAAVAPIRAPTAAPAATVAPFAVGTAQPSGSLTVATQNLGSGSGIPMFCTTGCAETVYLAGIMETLTGVEAGPGGPLDPWSIPMLAESWEIPADLSYLQFKLRQGIPFHQGWGEMTAEDVAFSFNNANAATNPDSIHGQAAEFAIFINEVYPVDSYTVNFDFNGFPAAVPLRYMSPFHQSAGIASKAAYDALGPQVMRQAFAGTGPFQVLEWKESETMLLEAVDDHWRQVPSVREVRIWDVPEEATRIAILKAGEAQIVGDLPFTEVARLETEGFSLQEDNGLAFEQSISFSGNYWETHHPLTGARLQRPRGERPWIGFSEDPGSMERARKVRWALAMAIDREIINEIFLEGRGEVCHLSQISIHQDGWQARWEIPFDPEKAKALLAEAGYPNGFEIPLWIGPGGLTVDLGDAVATFWRDYLNVDTNLDLSDYSSFQPGLLQRTNIAPFVNAGEEGRSGFPVHWPKGLQGSAITGGDWGPGFEDPVYSELWLTMNRQLDIGERRQSAEKYFNHAYEQMLQPCIVRVPNHPMYNPKLVAEWSPHPSMNANLSGMNSFETVVLAK